MMVELNLPEAIEHRVAAEQSRWQKEGLVTRLWAKDSSLWTSGDENKWLGWLGIVGSQLAEAHHLRLIADDCRKSLFKHVVVLGMGGSSLCPDVLRSTFGAQLDFPVLSVLDSVVPEQVLAIERSISLPMTLFIVASKSGSTIEPNALKQYFMLRMVETVGPELAPSHFIAVTDPGTKMEQIARGDQFRHVFFGLPTIGGRYSALSHFGMIPAAASGIDAAGLLQRAKLMVDACGPGADVSKNPGVQLGLVLSACTLAGRDKVTFVTSAGIRHVGAWIEQLLAESLGKIGKGLVPVDDERLGAPNRYGSDRLFVSIRLATDPIDTNAAALAELQAAGHPVVKIVLPSKLDLGAEFFRWEFATAVAGVGLGVHPFDQPDVEAAKIAARKVTAAYEETGKLPAETPLLETPFVTAFADPKNAAELPAKSGDLTAVIKAHLQRIKPGDYFAINAYVAMNDANHAALQSMRHAVRDRFRVATTLGYGPRFLHSTGQLHKGGPNSGVFLQVTSDDASDIDIPGQKFSFGVLKRAQAQGDMQVLADRERRILRLHARGNCDMATLAKSVLAAIDSL